MRKNDLTKKGLPRKKPGPKPSVIKFDKPIQFFFDEPTKDKYSALPIDERRKLITKVRTVVIDFING